MASNHYLYILHSEKFDKYYVGETNNIAQRIITHNTTDRKTYTSKYRPWEVVALFEVKDRATARKCERFIKKQKSRKFIIQIINGLEFNSSSVLAQLVRVPISRD